MNTSRSKVLETMLVLVTASGLVFWLTKNPYYLLAAAILAFTGLFIPSLAEKIHWAWMKLAMALGFVMSKVVLTIVYVFFLVPFAFLSRLFHKGSIRTKKSGQSYYTSRNLTYTKNNLENMW